MKCVHFQVLLSKRLVMPLSRLLLGVGLCTAALASDGAANTAQTGQNADEAPSSLYVHMAVRKAPPISYALVRQRNTTLFVGASQDLRLAQRYRKQAAGDYLWIRQGEQQYLLDDKAMLEKLLAHWQPLEQSEQEMAALEKQLQPYTDELESYAEELETITDVAVDIDTAELAETEALMDALQEKIEPISEQMEQVGQHIEALAEQAHQQTLVLIADAVQNGQARLLATQ